MRAFLRSLFARKRGGLADYERIELIARGGMSEVWKVRNNTDGAIYALKILSTETTELMKRFKEVFAADEGRIALRLDHPNVVHTFQYGQEGNLYYIVMEFVDGPNLERLIIQGDSRVRKNRFDILIQVGRGLNYIHRQGLIHRDFCPKNILYDSHNVTKIIDFGLTIPAASRPTSIVDLSGTASYMAPEQIKRLKLDERTDIYAFGVTAFEILTGRRPFPHSSDRERRLQYHLNVEPLKLRELDATLPEGLQEVIARCIEKKPELRYKSMDEVMRELIKALHDIPDARLA